MKRPTDQQPLTPAQQRVLDFIGEFVTRRGFPPTQAEIAAGLGFRSPNAAGEHLRLMAKKGVVRIEPNLARGLRIVTEKSAATARRPVAGKATARPRSRLPLIGQVAAGQPILAEENVERVIDVDPALFTPRADYLLRVRGESMIEAGILPRDLVAVHRTSAVENGRIAVVRLDDEVTVKRWRRRGGKVVLEPANAAMSPMVVDPQRTVVVVEGVVVGVVRLGVERHAP